MSRQVFFSFHYERDLWRANLVRNSWITKGKGTAAGFWDAAAQEAIKKNDQEAIARWIDSQLEGTSVTAVLISAQTYTRKWVKYEIQKSWDRGNGLFGIYIHGIENKTEEADAKGLDPFESMKFKGIKTYDWIDDDGYDNFAEWIEVAHKRAENRPS